MMALSLPAPPRALFFDVFGTCVDWRTTVTRALYTQSHAVLNSATASLASTVRLRACEMSLAHWGEFAQQWRDTYKVFTRRLAIDPSIPFKTVDEHHLDSLKQLVIDWHLDGLWTSDELYVLSLVWHRLDPWADTAQGIELLNAMFVTSTLSNGNYSLLADLTAHAKMPFTRVFSAEMFGTYKPAPEVYQGAAKKLCLSTGDCIMVAAHLNDLKAAKATGMQVIYVERPGEEDWSRADVDRAQIEGWVDLWVNLGDGRGGFLSVADKLRAMMPQASVVKPSSSG